VAFQQIAIMPENRHLVTLRLVVFSFRKSGQLHISIGLEPKMIIMVVLTKKVEKTPLGERDCAF
jgi:hypothetical protein